MFQENNFVRKILNVIIFLFMVMVLFWYGYEGKENNVPKALQGEIDLSKCNFEKYGLVNLDGQWELYWGELLEPSDFKDGHKNGAKDFFIIPSLLKTTVNNKSLPKFGYGTMRLLIKMPPNKERIYGIKTKSILCASKVWINGQLVTSAGIVGTEADNASGSFEHQMAFFNNDGSEVEIIVQMSNFNNVTGNVASICLGTDSEIKREYNICVASDTFIIGALFIMAMYHFALYYKRPKYKAPLYFGIFCLLISIRNALVGERIIFDVFPSIPFGLFNKIVYLTVYLGFPFIVMFFKELFPKQFSAKIIYPMNIISALISIVTVFSDIKVYDTFLIYYEICIIMISIYILYIIIKGVMNKNQGALIILFGFIAFLTTSVHDMLLQFGIFNTRSLVPFGFFVFIFSQSYILAARFSDAFIENERLIEENKAVYMDELTGILNRRGFYEQGGELFEDAMVTGESFILFYADLNKFKSINDSFGHKEGDEAIKQTAFLIKNSFGKDDIVARMSGDEFVAIAVNKESEEEADKIMEIIRSNFHKYNLHSKKMYKLSICIGYSIYRPNSVITFDELIGLADTMLYDNKSKIKKEDLLRG